MVILIGKKNFLRTIQWHRVSLFLCGDPPAGGDKTGLRPQPFGLASFLKKGQGAGGCGGEKGRVEGRGCPSRPGKPVFNTDPGKYHIGDHFKAAIPGTPVLQDHFGEDGHARSFREDGNGDITGKPVPKFMAVRPDFGKMSETADESLPMLLECGKIDIIVLLCSGFLSHAEVT